MKVDSFGSIDIAISGLRAQGKNMEFVSSNIANVQSTNNGEGEPYQRIEAAFKTDGDTIGGVTVDEIAFDDSDFPVLFKPGHPDADEQGYVRLPNVDLPVEMMNLNTAVRTYQANAAVLKRYQGMVETTLELLR